MIIRIPEHARFATYIREALRSRAISANHLVDLLGSVPESRVRSWLDGRSVPEVTELQSLADALCLNPVELTAGWLVDRWPVLEPRMRVAVFGPLRSSFLESTDTASKVLPPPRDMNVGDPHDAPRRPPQAKPS